MLPFLDPLRALPPVQRGPTDLSYESWAVVRTGGPSRSSCGSGGGTCTAGGAGSKEEACNGDAGCGCAQCDEDVPVPELTGLGSVTASEMPGSNADDTLKLTTPGTFWGVAPDGSWIFWEGRDIGWWDVLEGPWRPGNVQIDFPGPPTDGPPAPDPPCDGTTPGSCLNPCSKPLEPPPFSDVCWRTQLCFAAEYADALLESGGDWPPLPSLCLAPCIVERACELPTDGEREAIQSTVSIVVLTEEYLTAIGNVTPFDTDECNDWVAIGGVLNVDEQAYIESALAFLLGNADLVFWAACLTVGWSPQDSGTRRVDPATGNVVSLGLRQCLTDYLTGVTPWSVFVIDGFWAYDSIPCQDLGLTTATGSATRKFPGHVGPNGRHGVVIPIRYGYWQDRIDAFVFGSTSDALCAVLNLAEVILHELVHMCEDDTNSDCDPNEIFPDICCWEEQRMIASMFAWAVTQRYACLQSEPNCHADQATSFASSGWVDFQHIWAPDEEDAGC